MSVGALYCPIGAIDFLLSLKLDFYLLQINSVPPSHALNKEVSYHRITSISITKVQTKFITVSLYTFSYMF